MVDMREPPRARTRCAHVALTHGGRHGDPVGWRVAAVDHDSRAAGVRTCGTPRPVGDPGGRAMLAITVQHNDVELALRLLKRQLQNPGCSGSSAAAGSTKNRRNGGADTSARGSGTPANGPAWRTASARGSVRGITWACTLRRCNRTPNSVSQLRPTVEERSSRWTIARFIFLCRVACVCLVPWARTCLSAGQHRHVAHRHASHTASILAVLLCAVALPGIATQESASADHALCPRCRRSTPRAVHRLSTVSPLGLAASLLLR